MGIRLVAFDLDDTIAEKGKQVLLENVKIIRQIEEKGIQIVICSGKPAYYLCGFVRQMGLKHPILIGENGAVIQFGIELPPKKYYVFPCSKEAKQSIQYLYQKIVEIYPEMFFQPNRLMLTPFPKNQEEYETVKALIEKTQVKDVDIYTHLDCFDIVPKGITKGTGLKYLGELLHIHPEEMIGVGNGTNDYPMFAYVGTALGVKVQKEKTVTYNFETTTEMLKFIKKVMII